MESLRRDLILLQKYPAVENARSDSTLVGLIVRRTCRLHCEDSKVLAHFIAVADPSNRAMPKLM